MRRRHDGSIMGALYVLKAVFKPCLCDWNLFGHNRALATEEAEAPAARKPAANASAAQILESPLQLRHSKFQGEGLDVGN